MARLLDTLRFERVLTTVGAFEEAELEDQLYWKDRPPNERREAVEILRQVIYDYDPLTDRLPRILTVVELGED